MSYIKSNIKIALFMDWKIDNSFPDKNRIYRSPKNEIELDTTLKFHKSWNDLIPVAKKCLEITQDQNRPSINHCNNLDWLECQISIHLREYNFKEVYNAIVTFIDAHNLK